MKESTDRREFLRGLAAGATTATLVGCQGLVGEVAVTRRIDEALRGLDRALDALEARPVGIFTAARARGYFTDVDDAEVLADADAFAKRAMRSLLILGAVHDLDAEAFRSPELIRAMERYGAELDDTFEQSALALATVDSVTAADLREFATHDRDFVDLLGSALDARSSEYGVGGMSRVKLRAAVNEVKRSLRVRPPAAYAEEVLQKVDRVAAMATRQAAAGRVVADRITTRALSHAFAQTIAPAPPGGAPMPPTGDPEMVRAERLTRAGRSLCGAGFALLGIGVGIAVSASSFDVSIGGAFVATAGSILLFVSLIVAIVAIRRRRMLRERELTFYLAP